MAEGSREKLISWKLGAMSPLTTGRSFRSLTMTWTPWLSSSLGLPLSLTRTITS